MPMVTGESPAALTRKKVTKRSPTAAHKKGHAIYKFTSGLPGGFSWASAEGIPPLLASFILGVAFPGEAAMKRGDETIFPAAGGHRVGGRFLRTP